MPRPYPCTRGGYVLPEAHAESHQRGSGKELMSMEIAGLFPVFSQLHADDPAPNAISLEKTGTKGPPE
jgi:hypothetical protein